MRFSSRLKVRGVLFLMALVALVASGLFQASATLASSSFLGPFHDVRTLTSTVPGNGDVNPYGLVVVHRSIGKLVRGDALISNFNNSKSLQGTGTTIVEISPNGTLSLFARINPAKLDGSCPGSVGLTTALVVLRRGWVIVGSLPTTNGMSATAEAGCLIVLNSEGHVVETFTGDGINGPWDMTVSDNGSEAALFVTNVLNGTVSASPNVVHEGTILRIDLKVPQQSDGVPSIDSMTMIGSGFAERTDPMALVVGPTGVGLGFDGTLYVADTVNSRIAAISDALDRDSSDGTGDTVTHGKHVNGPLGLTIAPNGDILSVNGGDGNIVETTPDGHQVAVRLLDKTAPVPTGGAGTLFGVAVVPGDVGVYYVDDGNNTLRILN